MPLIAGLLVLAGVAFGVISMMGSDNTEVQAQLDALDRGEHRFFRLTLEDGTELDGWEMRPPGFEAGKSYPVLFFVIGEPWGQTVKDTWSLGHHLFHRWVSQQGYVVMSVDARGTPAPKGRDWRKALYQNIGVVSSHDWSQAVPALLARHAGWSRADAACSLGVACLILLNAVPLLRSTAARLMRTVRGGQH